MRDGVQVKRLPMDGDLYVPAQSTARIDKERGMRRQRLTRDQQLMKLGAAKQAAGRGATTRRTLPATYES